MIETNTKLENIIENLETVDINGNSITLRNVPKLVDKQSNHKWVKLEDVIAAEEEFIADKYDLNIKQIPILNMLYAKLPYKLKGAVKVSEGHIEQILRFHKMLFEAWQKTIDIGYDGYPHHKFYADVYGPVSKDFKPAMEDLEKKGLVDAQWSTKNGIPSIFTLTSDGFQVADKIWINTPDEIKKVFEQTKDELSLKSAQEIMHFFHNKYPKYRRKREMVVKVLEKYKKVEAMS